MAKIWSDDEVKLLRKLVQSKTQREIAERLGRSMKSVERKLYGMRRKKRKKQAVPAWPKDDVALLKRLFLVKTAQEVADRLARSVWSVRRKAYKMGLQRTIAPWSEDEVKLLKELYPHESRKVMANKLGRSLSSITNKAHKLGLKQLRRSLWSKRELNMLKELYPYQDSRTVADKLGRSVLSITDKAFALGLKKRKRPVKYVPPG